MTGGEKVNDNKIRLTPKGLALGLVVEAGFTSRPPTDEDMDRFHRFWEQVEQHLIPMVLKRVEEAEACEAPASKMD